MHADPLFGSPQASMGSLALSQSHPDYSALENGAKLACGLEMLYRCAACDG